MVMQMGLIRAFHSWEPGVYKEEISMENQTEILLIGSHDML
jgi:hypothetical protein